MVEAKLGSGIPDVPYCVPDDFLKIYVARSCNLSGQNCKAGGHKSLACNSSVGILGEDRVKDLVGDLISYLVGMPFGYGLRSKQMAAVVTHLTNSFTGSIV